jgi:hypothetical protein
MIHWDTEDSSQVISHEIGHLIALKEEYYDSRVPDRLVTDESSIMYSPTGEVQEWHFKAIARWVGLQTGTRLKVRRK